MAGEKKLSDVVWIVLIWLLALGFAIIAIIKFRLFFHG